MILLSIKSAHLAKAMIFLLYSMCEFDYLTSFKLHWIFKNKNRSRKHLLVFLSSKNRILSIQCKVSGLYDCSSHLLGINFV